MRLVLAPLLTFLLCGCAIASVVPTQYDPVEYDHYVDLERLVVNNKVNCNNPEVMRGQVIPKLYEQVQLLIVYTSNKYNNSSSYETIGVLNNIVVELQRNYNAPNAKPPSQMYCELKFDSLKIGVDRTLRMIGKQRR